MKNVLIIGMGRFGSHIASKLRELGHEVMAVDDDESRINDCLPYVTNGLIGDATKEKFLRTLGVDNFDLCVVAIGGNFEASLQATALLKELGARLVVSRAGNSIHEKFLLNNGADHVLYPSRLAADWGAVRYTSDHVLDYIQFDKDYSIFETPVPPEWEEHTLSELAVRQKHRLNVLAVRSKGQMKPMPGPDYRFVRGDSIYVMGHNKDLQKFLRSF